VQKSSQVQTDRTHSHHHHSRSDKNCRGDENCARLCDCSAQVVDTGYSADHCRQTLCHGQSSGDSLSGDKNDQHKHSHHQSHRKQPVSGNGSHREQPSLSHAVSHRRHCSGERLADGYHHRVSSLSPIRRQQCHQHEYSRNLDSDDSDKHFHTRHHRKHSGYCNRSASHSQSHDKRRHHEEHRLTSLHSTRRQPHYSRH